jgi:hypothetical protein
MVRAALGPVACAGAARLGTLTGSVGKEAGPFLAFSMFSPPSLADSIGDRLPLGSVPVLPPHISHQISGHNQRKEAYHQAEPHKISPRIGMRLP